MPSWETFLSQFHRARHLCSDPILGDICLPMPSLEAERFRHGRLVYQGIIMQFCRATLRIKAECRSSSGPLKGTTS